MARDADISRFLSFVLRHDPASAGLTLDAGGWVEVETLLAASPLLKSRADLERIVAESDKKRFAFSKDGQRVRASQGHSFPVDLGLAPVAPPEILYHGTATRFLDAILADGLRAMSRQHVHLSPDVETALAVGRRHGAPVILSVDAKRLQERGQSFFLSANGVWLTGDVPAAALAILS